MPANLTFENDIENVQASKSNYLSQGHGFKPQHLWHPYNSVKQKLFYDFWSKSCT